MHYFYGQVQIEFNKGTFMNLYDICIWAFTHIFSLA